MMIWSTRLPLSHPLPPARLIAEIRAPINHNRDVFEVHSTISVHTQSKCVWYMDHENREGGRRSFSGLMLWAQFLWLNPMSMVRARSRSFALWFFVMLRRCRLCVDILRDYSTDNKNTLVKKFGSQFEMCVNLFPLSLRTQHQSNEVGSIGISGGDQRDSTPCGKATTL
jgi:hypothetical protein